MADAPQGQAPSEKRPPEKRPHAPRREAVGSDDGARRSDDFHVAREPKPHRKPHGDGGAKFADAPSFGKKKKHRDKPAHAGQSQSVTPWSTKGAPGKKAKKKHRG
jgi:ATP-dependent RNA helicase DeaD